MNGLVFYGAMGGFLVNVLNLIELRSVPITDRPDFSDWIYWLPFIVWPFAGGLLVHVYLSSGIGLRPLLAFNVGLSAPLTLRAMAEANLLGRRLPASSEQE